MNVNFSSAGYLAIIIIIYYKIIASNKIHEPGSIEMLSAILDPNYIPRTLRVFILLHTRFFMTKRSIFTFG